MKNHSNQFGFGHVGVLIISVVVIAIGGAGYFVYSRNDKKDSSVATSKSSSSSESATQTKQDEPNKQTELKKQDSVKTYTYNPSDYVGWKEYCSNTEKACFSYPAEWILTDNNAGKEVDGVGNKITPDMESIRLRSPSTPSYEIGATWNNFISGLGGACFGDENKAEFLSYQKINSRPNDYIVEYTSKDSEGKALYRLLNYDNKEPMIGLTSECVNTFYYFFKGKNLTGRDILFEASGTDDVSRELANKVVRSFRYQ